ncbi:MAG: putative RNA uridine N3 methyltransferase [Candidatus Heimdallarchaeota archaeon]
MHLVCAIPDSAVSDTSDLRIKTEKLYQIARAVAIFRASEILIYHDPFLKPSRAKRERKIISRILRYIECPQYLRKRLFPLYRETAAVGILPPLATPHHGRFHKLKRGEIREAAVFLNQGKVVADVGGPHLLEVSNPPRQSLKDRTVRYTVKIEEINGKWQANVIDPPRKLYWGFSVNLSEAPLGKALLNRKEILIATSRSCQPLSAATFKEKSSEGFLVAFGGPYNGIPNMLKNEGKKIQDVFGICLSVISNYGTRSLRLEEAIIITFTKLDQYLTGTLA